MKSYFQEVCGGFLLVSLLGCSNMVDVFSQVSVPGLVAAPVIPAPMISPSPSPSPEPSFSPSPGPASCNLFGSSDFTPKIWGRLGYLPSAAINLVQDDTNYGMILTSWSPGAPNNFESLWTQASISDMNFYFSELNVPIQWFSLGFQLTDPTTGLLVTLDYPGTSSPIVSYFGFTFYTDIIVPAGCDGLYYFQLNSDDGSNLYILTDAMIGNPPSVPTRLPSPFVDDDGQHGMTTAASTRTYLLSSTFPTHLVVQWYQGPPHDLGVQLALQPLIPTSGECPVSWSSTSWNIIPPAWYSLPNYAPIPTCSH